MLPLSTLPETNPRIRIASVSNRKTLSPTPSPLARGLDRFATRLLFAKGEAPFDFSSPRGEPALVAPDSISWQVFKNPLALFVGGVAAVILEFAEPRVRAGVWEHSSFRTNPLARLQRTGMAAMMTVYGPRRAALAMIAHVTALHYRVVGTSPEGWAYRANDPELLTFVHATALFGFGQAFSRYVRPLSSHEWDRFCAEGLASAAAYGATGAPANFAALEQCLAEMESNLSSSPILEEFLAIMGGVSLLPLALKPLQRLFVRAAIDIVPPAYRTKTALGPHRGLHSCEKRLIRRIATFADTLPLPSLPPAQSCRRLDLPADYLYHRPVETGAQTANILIGK